MEVFFDRVSKNLKIAPKIDVGIEARRRIHRFVEDHYDAYMDYIEDYAGGFFDYSTFLDYLSFHSITPPHEDTELIFEIMNLLLEAEVYEEDPYEMLDLLFSDDEIMDEALEGFEFEDSDEEKLRLRD